MENRKHQRDLIGAFQYLKEVVERWRKIFSRACCDRSRSNGFKLKGCMFRLDVGKKFFMMKVVKHWNRLPHPWQHSKSVEWGGGVEQPDLVEHVPSH